MKEIIKTSFMQLLIVYTILVFLSSLTIFSKFTLHFEIFAVILAIFAIISINKEKEVKINKFWFYFAILFILLIRIIPYVNNTVPLGYDPGLYHYIMQNSSVKDMWVIQSFEPGLFMLTDIIKLFGMSVNSILTYGLVFLELLLGISIYFVTKKYFNQSTAIIAIILYAVSTTQFIAFAYNYYKQIAGLVLLLWSLYFLKEKPTKLNTILFVAFASFLGAVHRPTFLIFGLIYIAHIIKNSVKKLDKRNILLGIMILTITLLFYIGRIEQIILPWLTYVATADIGSGTFFNLQIYQLLSLAYLPFALFGLFFMIKKKDINPILSYAIINGLIVILKLIFFNRYIISLDIALIISAAYGLYLTLQNKLGVVIAVILIASSGFITYQNAIHTEPLVQKEELNIIESLNTTEPNAFVMSTDSEYSPWLLYSDRKVIAPGMFDYDNWTKEEWMQFWNNTNVTQLMNRYSEPVYVFVSKNQLINEDIFKNECFDIQINKTGTRLYKWIC